MRGRIAHEWDDEDGYWICLNAGWRMPGDERSKVMAHQICEDTKTKAHAKLKQAIRCNCEECEEILAESKAEQG